MDPLVCGILQAQEKGKRIDALVVAKEEGVVAPSLQSEVGFRRPRAPVEEPLFQVQPVTLVGQSIGGNRVVLDHSAVAESGQPGLERRIADPIPSDQVGVADGRCQQR